MIKPGMFINERYEIIDKVGSGGMADVYKAKCHRLNRYVAIKILKAEYSTDSSFVTKFRAEAQSVAGLSHPNIVSVYDVGDDDGLHYIVMELVEGITLKKYIERKKRLDIREAVGIAIQICQGMEAAHTHHIIHRDIKPQNIIISREGKVKVADFGIAKAATSNTISQNAIGSVHYLSPEQARGGYSDERSDIYSLGVTLYEMLTGQVPFAGDNSVSVALLHIQSEATPVQVLNPEIPTSVDRIVQKCMQKKPERRYQTASELIRDLKRSIVNPEGDYVNIPSNAEVSDSPTRSISEDELTTIKSAAKSPVVHYESPQKPKQTRIKKVHREAEELDSVDSPFEKFLIICGSVICVAVLVVIGYIVYVNFFKGDDDPAKTDPSQSAISNENVVTTPPPSSSSLIVRPDDPTPTPVPEPTDPIKRMREMIKVSGYTLEKAKERLLLLVSPDLQIRYEEQYSDVVEKGCVIKANYAEGLLVEPDEEIILTVSVGPAAKVLSMDGIIGSTKDTAERLVIAYGFIPEFIDEYSETVPEGIVIRHEPENGEMASAEDPIKVYVSAGPQFVVMPMIIGYDEETAKIMLAESGLVVGSRTGKYSDEYPSGIVFEQSIEAGYSVVIGTMIDYSFSIGSYMSSGTPTPTPTTRPRPTATPIPTPTPASAGEDRVGDGGDGSETGTDNNAETTGSGRPRPVG